MQRQDAMGTLRVEIIQKFLHYQLSIVYYPLSIIIVLCFCNLCAFVSFPPTGGLKVNRSHAD
jgi:hypothetical protein